MTKDEAMELFHKYNSVYYSRNTLRSYEITANQFLSFYPDIDKVEDFTSKNISGFLNYYTNQNYEPMGIRFKYYALRSFFLTLYEMDKLPKNPIRSIRTPKEHQNILTIVTYADIFNLRQASRDHIRDRAILELLWATGVRVEELCNIKLSDLHLDSRTIFLPETKDYHARHVIFTPFCKEWVSDYYKQRKNDSPYFFHSRNPQKPLTTQSIRDIIKKYRDIAGIKNEITPHSFRRSFAAILYKNGVPIEYIAKLMGHVNLKTTYRYVIYAKFI